MITKVFHQRSGSTMQQFNPCHIHYTGKSNRFSSQNVSRRHPLSPHPPPPPTSAPLQSSPTCCGNDMSLSCQRLPCSQRSPEAPRRWVSWYHRCPVRSAHGALSGGRTRPVCSAQGFVVVPVDLDLSSSGVYMPRSSSFKTQPQWHLLRDALKATLLLTPCDSTYFPQRPLDFFA